MIGIAWAAVKPWLKSLNLWLVLVIAGLVAVIWVGRVKLEERKAEAARSNAFAAQSTGTMAAAVANVTAANEAEASTPLPADKAAVLALCAKSASCRERGQR
jgi:hypothetical protein